MTEYRRNSIGRNIFWGLLGLALVVEYFSFIYKRDADAHVVKEKESEKPIVQAQLLDPTPQANTQKETRSEPVASEPVVTNFPSPTMSKKTKIVQMMPSLEVYRQEVAANPHKTPQSLTTFSFSVAQRIQDAKGDRQKQHQLFDELAECGLLNSDVISIRAFCFEMAQKLAENNQDHESTLAQKWYELNQKIPDRIRMLIAPL